MDVCMSDRCRRGTTRVSEWRQLTRNNYLLSTPVECERQCGIRCKRDQDQYPFQCPHVSFAVVVVLCGHLSLSVAPFASSYVLPSIWRRNQELFHLPLFGPDSR